MTERSKAAINRMLAEGGEHAEVAVATDPHTQQRGEQTPDLT
jgi:small conductance mechanosensitive channel